MLFRGRLKELIDGLNSGEITYDLPPEIEEELCTYFGAHGIISWISDAVTIVNSPVGCATNFRAVKRIRTNDCELQHAPYLSTNFQEDRVIFGGEDYLLETVLQADKKLRPSIIVVLDTCCSEIIGDDVDGALRSLKGKVEAELLAIHCGGACGNSLREGSELTFEALVDLMEKPVAKNPCSVNLVLRRFFPADLEDLEYQEMARLLKKIGISVNSSIRFGCSFDDFVKAPQASGNATFCATIGRSFCERMGERFGMPYSLVTLPIGLSPTLKWLTEIANIVGLDKAVANVALVEEISRYQKRIDEVRERVEGKTAVLWLPVERSLAVARFVMELGMVPICIGFNAYSVDQVLPSAQLLCEDGVNPEVIELCCPSFSEVRELILKEINPALCFCNHKYFPEYPTVEPFRFPHLGLAGLSNLLDKLVFALDKPETQSHSLFTF